ncbi:MFS transporter [Pseudonocardia acaciae]|uniref:MFS transporter n=1 Tax=Pseudonocardia acaciae TaxID=551276 RepID=UPI0007E8D801|nr:MFS transporter [Pseudonocardia acaciae]
MTETPIPKNTGSSQGTRRAGGTRWTIIGMVFIATSINYLDRANLGVALPYMSGELGLSKTSSGILLGAFFWTYALMQFPSGWLVDRFGPRRMLAIAVAAWSVATMLMGAATGFLVLILLRLLLGVGESPSYPSGAKVVSRWFPVHERGLAASIFDSGARAGTALSLPIIAALIAVIGWRGSFVAAGLLGFVFVAVWLRLYRDPDEHPGVSEQEKALIRDGQPDDGEHERAALPWHHLFRYRTTWGMVLGFFCLSFVLYFFITWFPSYLVDARGFDLLKLGIFGMLPALLAIPAQWVGGLLQGRLIRRGHSVSYARKVPLISGLVLASVIVFAGEAPNAATALTLLTISYCALTFAASSLWALPADVAPAPGNVASLAGIQGFASNAAGLASPIVIGVLLDATGGSYAVPLAVAGAVAIAGALVYGLVIGQIVPLGSRDLGSPPPIPRQT